MIDRTLKSKGNTLTISYLCESAGVSRSGYYAWAKRKDAPESYPCQKEVQDEKDFELILEAFKERKCDKGRCMLIARTFKSSLLQRWSAHLWQNSMTEVRA